MKSVVVPLEFDDLSRKALRVSGLGVRSIEIHRSFLVLEVAYKCRPPAEDRTHELVLSIPAAAQLARDLEAAVQKYLGEEKE